MQLVVLLRVDALVLLEILWTLEGLSADGTRMRFEWRMNCQDISGCRAGIPRPTWRNGGDVDGVWEEMMKNDATHPANDW